MKQNIMADESRFNYSAFNTDLLKALGEKKETLASVSENKLFKSESYLSNALKKKRLPLNMIFALCDWYGLNAKDYEICIEQPPIPEPEEQIHNCSTQSNPWGCEIKIDPDFDTTMLKITKNGKQIAVGRAYLFGATTVDVIKSISYAAHMAYKLAEQNKMEEVVEDKAVSLLYKDWIKKYEQATTAIGKLARYISDHYRQFPSSGQKKMQVFLMQNSGGSHINAFKLSFDMYLDWYKANFQ